MTPLQKCREAIGLSLSQLSIKLNNIQGSSKTSLSRLEKFPSTSINKKLSTALVYFFQSEGLTIEHLLNPESYPDFTVDYTHNDEKTLVPKVDDEKSILVSATNKWFSSSSMNISKFAKELYNLLAPVGLADPIPTVADEYDKYISSAIRRINRIIKGDLPFHLEWKIYWLACLPENVRQQALAQIMALTGYMVVPLPVNKKLNIDDTRAKLEDVTQQFSQVLSHSKPALDGFYDERDCINDLQLMQDKLSELVASALREMTLIECCTGITSKVNQIYKNSVLSK